MPQIPVLVQILVIFALVVLASAKKLHLGLAAALGGILFGFLQGLSPLLVLQTILTELFKADTLLLLLLVSGIMVFSSAMKQAGGMALFSKALLALVPSRRLALALAPVLIGTLPMPGGAILSAPLVDAFDPQRSRSATTLSATNYWFRHILELCWPLYPAFILTATLTGLPVNRLMLLNLYAPPLLFLLGMIFILPRQNTRLPPALPSPAAAPENKLRLILEGFTPLVLIIGGYAVLDLLWRLVGPLFAVPAALNTLISRYAWIFTGLIAACLYIGLRYGWKSYQKAFNLSTLKLTGVVAGIKVFAALLTAAGVAESSAAELASLGIPALIAVALLPLVPAW
ncbi:MAG: DUF401 family protein [Spirochaetes bacterium]|nr:DUF401 family protein [Spirochaetota bacterium]